MLSIQQYLTESVILTEATNDPRRNPPKFTDEQQANNKKLIQHVIQSFDKKVDYDFKYAIAYGIDGNKNYRTSLLMPEEHVTRDRVYYGEHKVTGIDIVTDSNKNQVSIVVRTNPDLGRRRDIKPWAKIVKQLHKKIEPALKQIAKRVTVRTINTANQFGYTYTLADVDYTECKSSSARIQKYNEESNRTKNDRFLRDISNRIAKSKTQDQADRYQWSKQSKQQISKTPFYKIINKVLQGTGFVPAAFNEWQAEVELKYDQSGTPISASVANTSRPVVVSVNIMLGLYDKTSDQVYIVNGLLNYLHPNKNGETINIDQLKSTPIGKIEKPIKLAVKEKTAKKTTDKIVSYNKRTNTTREDKQALKPIIKKLEQAINQTPLKELL